MEKFYPEGQHLTEATKRKLANEDNISCIGCDKLVVHINHKKETTIIFCGAQKFPPFKIKNEEEDFIENIPSCNSYRNKLGGKFFRFSYSENELPETKMATYLAEFVTDNTEDTETQLYCLDFMGSILKTFLSQVKDKWDFIPLKTLEDGD